MSTKKVKAINKHYLLKLRTDDDKHWKDSLLRRLAKFCLHASVSCQQELSNSTMILTNSTNNIPKR